MARPGIDRNALIADLAAVFCARGFEGATLAELARATGLGKASLYHHFPGGKTEMVSAVVRQAVNDLQQTVFRHLETRQAPGQRIADMLDGFDRYVDHGADNCLLAVLAQGSARSALGAGVHVQFEAWLARLEQTLREAGMRPKRAARTARQVLTTLYGAVVMSRLVDDPKLYAQVTRRLRRELKAPADKVRP